MGARVPWLVRESKRTLQKKARLGVAHFVPIWLIRVEPKIQKGTVMRTRSYGIFAIVFALGALVVACNDDDEVQDYVSSWASSTADFSAYETYAFLTEDDLPRGTKPLPDDVKAQLAVVNDAMRSQLNARGLREVSSDDMPDLYAFDLASTREESALYWDCVDGWWYGWWIWSWDPCAYLQPVYTEYEVGTVVVGLGDPAIQEVVFGGVLQGVLTGGGDAEERIQDGVAEIFDDYPVPPTSESSLTNTRY